MLNFLVINGPNLNMQGLREKEVYGSLTLEGINKLITDAFKYKSVNIDFFQSNVEGEIINKLHSSRIDYSAIIINPGAYSHYSIAILDAIRCIDIPVVEVHLSNIFSRETFRQKSVTSSACLGVVSGFGYYGYIMAINYMIEKLNDRIS